MRKAASRTSVLLLAVLLFCSCRKKARVDPAQASSSTVTLLVPHAGGIVLDGDFDDPGWQKSALTGTFVDEFGAPARPHNEAKFAWDGETLFVAFYAADENIRTDIPGVSRAHANDRPLWLADDVHFAFTVGEKNFAIDVSPTGIVTDGVSTRGGPVDYSWNSDVHVAHEMEGTPDNPNDHDEEWLIEMALPLSNLGLEGRVGEAMGLLVRRCDTGRDERKSCATAKARRLELE